MIRNLKFGLLTLVLAGGCAQILGLSDYEVDPSLGGDSGEGGEGTGQGGSDQEGGSGGSTTQGGEPGVGGEPAVGGETGVGGEPGSAGAGGQGEGGAPPGGEVVPCDSLACCDAQDGTAIGEELLPEDEGGFELGPIGDGLTGWTHETTTVGLELINSAGGGWEPRSGIYFAYLSGKLDEVSTIWSPDVLVPSDAGWLELVGYRLFQIDTVDNVNFDFSIIDFYGYEPTDPEENLFDWGDPTISPDGWGVAPNWTRFAKSWDAAPHLGAIRYLALRGYSDDYSTHATLVASSYLYDDLSLKVYRCYR